MKQTGWDRRLWGVVLFDSGLLGTGWNRDIRESGERYDGAPTRALLFTSRATARDWCVRKHAEYATRPDGDPCRAWRFRAVRVRERITVT